MPEDFAAYMSRLDERLARRIPPRREWNPSQRAVYGVLDLFRLPAAEAETLQLAAIRHAFAKNYAGNPTYRRYCREHGVSPDDVTRLEHLERIPLLSDRFFKQSPEGRDFAVWLANLHTGELPHILVAQRRPTRDQVLDAFNRAGLEVSFSSGTSGRLTFIPRDRATFVASGHALAKGIAAMAYPGWDRQVHGCLLLPHPRRTSLYAGRVAEGIFDALEEVETPLKSRISAAMIERVMARPGGGAAAPRRLLARLVLARVIARAVRWLRRHEGGGSKLTLVGPPFLIQQLLARLRREGRRFELGGRGGVITGGGWKTRAGERLALGEFRRQVQEQLGIAPERCLDVYGMVEGNGWMVHCPEGHHLHVPTSYFRPLVLDERGRPLGFGQRGRFAFLDGLATSYPGFIATGDEVRLLERCPACDRPGPVIEPEIARMPDEEARGCAEGLRRTLAPAAGG